MHFKLVFLATAYFKVAVGSMKIGEAIIFLVNPLYLVLLYLMIWLALQAKDSCSLV